MSKKVRITAYFTESLIKKVESAAAEMGLSVSSFCSMAVCDYLKQADLLENISTLDRLAQTLEYCQPERRAVSDLKG